MLCNAGFAAAHLKHAALTRRRGRAAIQKTKLAIGKEKNQGAKPPKQASAPAPRALPPLLARPPGPGGAASFAPITP